MDGDKQNPVLRSMTAGAQRPETTASELALLLRSCERAADKAIGLPMSLGKAQEHRVSLDGIAALLPVNTLVGLLEGGTAGFLAMGLPVSGGIVEHCTIGKVLSGPGSERRPTRVDAALVSNFVDAALMRFAAAVGDALERASCGGAHMFGAMVADARALLLTLPVAEYRVFSYEVSLADGARTGPLIFGFAEPARDECEPAEAAQSAGQAATLRAGVLAAPAKLDAVLARLPLPLSQLQGLKVGDMLPLPANALAHCTLSTRSRAGDVPVRLGQIDGMRAVRLGGVAPSDDPALQPAIGLEDEDVIDAVATNAVPETKQPPQTAAALGADKVARDHPGDLDALLAAAEPDEDLLTPV